MRFLTKAVIQKVLSHLPFGDVINDQLHKKKVSEASHYYVVKQWLDMVSLLYSRNFSLEGKAVLELGVGWKPVIALLMKCIGASEVIMLDQKRYITDKLLLSTISDLFAFEERIISDLQKRKLPWAEFQRNLTSLRSKNLMGLKIDSLLNTVGLNYVAPYKANLFPFADSSIDLLYSRQVMEHVPESQIKLIYQEAFRVLQKTGLMFHIIDVEDHWSYSDKKITGLNFLKYNDFEWKLINSPIAYQNRLRTQEHINLIKDSSFEIRQLIPGKKKMQLEEVQALQPYFNEKFTQYSIDELAILNFSVLACPLKN